MIYNVTSKKVRGRRPHRRQLPSLRFRQRYPQFSASGLQTGRYPSAAGSIDRSPPRFASAAEPHVHAAFALRKKGFGDVFT